MRIALQRSTREKGFTLIEVLASLVLVGIVLPVALRGVSLCLAASHRAKASLEGATLAETKLNELVAASGLMVPSGAGDFGPEWPDYRWSALSMERDGNLTEVEVVVTWTERGTDRSMSLSTLLYPGSQ